MQQLVRHRIPMLAVILGILAALSSTLVTLITMGQPEETSIPETSLHNDDSLVASNYAKGSAHLGLGIMNSMEHRIVSVVDNTPNAAPTTTDTANISNDVANNNKKYNTPNAAPTTTDTANISNDVANNNKKYNTPNADDHAIFNREKNKNDDITAGANPNIFINSKNGPLTMASCGQVITRDVTLLKDLECDGVGLIVGSNEITINLNNHRLSLANNTGASRIPEMEKIGILIPGQKNVTIVGPGVIIGFDKAIEFVGSGVGYVLDVKLANNNIGISLKASDEITIYRSFIEGNGIGIASQSSTGALIISNQVSQNANQGIVLMDSNSFIVGANSLIGNGNIGIFLDVRSFNNTLSSNNILNHAVDVSNADGIPIHISMNEYFENSCGKALPDGLC
jgi:parallel beta-helix repeat protein